MSEIVEDKRHWLDRPALPILKLDLEKTLYGVFILLAIASRFWLLGERAMSHDESLHTFYSWTLYQGGGYSHTPLTHGPFLFHINALIYSLFGADDFTSRISVALFGVALVALPYTLRRWLGRTGALVTAFMILISPSLWYHARYIRDEAFMLVWIMLVVWGVFSYLHDRATKWLYLIAVAAAFAFISMEAMFIFVAIFGFFLIAATLIELADRADFWRGIALKLALGGLGVGVILFVAVIAQALLLGAIGLAPGDPSPFPAPAQPLQAGQSIEFSAQLQYILQLLWGVLRVGLSMLIPAGLIGFGSYRWLKSAWPAAARESRSFDLVIVLGSLSLFLLSAALLPILNSVWKILYQLPFVDVSKKTEKEGLANPDMTKVDIKTTIKNNIITIEPFKFKAAGFRVKIAGESSFDGNLNLKMRLGLPPLGIFGIPVRVTGTGTMPRIRFSKGSGEDENIPETEYSDQIPEDVAKRLKAAKETDIEEIPETPGEIK